MYQNPRSRRFAPPAAPRADSTLTIPDALLEWGSEPSRVVGWTRDWAKEVRELAAASDAAPLAEKDTQRLLARLEALVCEAIYAGRPDLLTGLDMLTAEWLGLQYAFEGLEGHKITIGRDAMFGWSEVRVLTEAFQHASLAKRLREEGSGGEGWPEPSGLGRLAFQMLMVREEFPDARISAARPLVSYACVVCGDARGVTRIEVAPDEFYCAACWPAFKETQAKVAWVPPVAVEVIEGAAVDEDALTDEQRALDRWRMEKEVRDREKRAEDKKRRAEQAKAK